MKKSIVVIFVLLQTVSFQARAQFETFKDSVVQLFGVVMTADSLRALPSVSVVVKGQNRGTITSDRGVFSIVVLKGDKVEFSCVGFKSKLVEIPRDVQGNQYSLVQLMVNDTIYLPATVIRSRVTREQFERDFLNTKVPDDEIAIARANNDAATRRFLMQNLPQDGREASSKYLRQAASKLYYTGQIPPMQIFNPAAWNEFIQAWKRGDFRKKQP